MNRLLFYLRYDWPLHWIMLLTDWMPNNVIFFRFRGLLARPFFGSCGPHLSLGRNLTFKNASNIHLGRHVYIAFGCVLFADGAIHIEDEVLIAPYVVFATGNHSKHRGSYRFSPPQIAPIHVGSGSWIGTHASILAGANIGKGCAIGSNAAVLCGNIPENSLAAGVPAVIKKRAV